MSGLCLLLFTGTPVQAMVQAESDTLSLWVNGLCGMCKATIEKAAYKTPGVEEASWDAETRTLSLEVNPKRFKEDRLHYRIASSGYDTRSMLAPDPVYDALPMCCKYRDFKNHEEAQAAESHEGEQPHAEEGLVRGQVYELDASGELKALPGANVYWLGAEGGSTSDSEGTFEIPLEAGQHMLVVSFVGMGSDTLHVHDPSQLEVVFSGATALEGVSITHEIKPTSLQFNSAYNIRNISEKELTKAACCNLSESFETNPSVDASFTDAVTGTRQIEMLGLAGPYVQITRENMPEIRGLLSLYGLNYIPGTWIHGMQLNMGAGSVVNGYESMTGQINVELRKPWDSDRLFLNAYANSDGAFEGNLQTAYALGEHWKGSLQLHGNFRPFALDQNEDGFRDLPGGETLVALKRFQYKGEHGFNSQIGIRGIYADHLGGQMDFDPDQDREDQPSWGTGTRSKGIEVWAKAGKIFENRPYSSLGFQVSGLFHDQESFFGLTRYDARQQSYYANLIYQGILGNTNHQYRTGLSFQGDHFDEAVNAQAFERREYVPGVFLEYTFNFMDRFTAVMGIRGDYHNRYGAFVSPRMHLRYEPVDRLVFRASAGRGLRTSSVFAENIGMFASSRQLFLEGNHPDGAYGLGPEIAWSLGFNVAKGLEIGNRELVLSADFYHTRFMEQVLVDYDQAPSEVHIYMLDGDSRSNSFQAQAEWEVLDRFDLRLAYRLNDVYSQYEDQWLARPLTARHRAFVNLAYATSSEWNFDLTWNWQGSKRIPSTQANPEPYQLDAWSPSFSLVNLQVGKNFDRLELYGGIENLLGFHQEDPILAAGDPFGPYFDASLIWGPIMGQKYYLGLRYRIR